MVYFNITTLYLFIYLRINEKPMRKDDYWINRNNEEVVLSVVKRKT